MFPVTEPWSALSPPAEGGTGIPLSAAVTAPGAVTASGGLCPHQPVFILHVPSAANPMVLTGSPGR